MIKKISYEQLEEEWRLLYHERKERQEELGRINQRMTEILKIINETEWQK